MLTAWREIRRHPSRLVAALLAIVISVGFIVASLVFVATETHSIGARLTEKTSRSDIVARVSEQRPGAVGARITAVPGVAAAVPTYTGSIEFAGPGGSGELDLDSLPADPALRWSRLTAGRWPQGATEIAVGAPTARSYGMTVGSRLTIAADPQLSNGATLTVTGIIDQSRSLFGEISDSGVADTGFFAARDGGLQQPTYLIRARPGIDIDQLAARIRSVLPADSDVETSAAVTATTVSNLTHDAQVFRYLLLIFGAIALLVGSMIIVNTFTIIVAQRRRQLGLLRALGASVPQIRRQLVAEGVLVGAVGALLGVAFGSAVALVAAAVTGSLADGLIIPAGQLVLAAAVGLLITVFACLVPAHRATRVSPLEVLRPVADLQTSRRTSQLRLIIGLAMVAVGAGVVAVALSVSSDNLVLAIAGSLVLAVGILALAPVFLPTLLRLTGRLLGHAGPVARLASSNTIRNPARAAATCTALMLGVGLIVTLQVGAASIKSTTNDTLNSQYPVDISVTNPQGPLAPGLIAAVAAVPGVRTTTPVRMITAAVKNGADTLAVTVAGVRPDAGTVVAAGLDQLNDRVALVHPFTLEMIGHAAGDELTLRYDGRRETFLLVASDVAAEAGTLVVTDDALTRLAPGAPTASVWARATDRTHAGAVMAGVRQAASQQPGLVISGSLPDAAALNTVLDTLLAVATGLLAVAVGIALIGVGNTLGLSVIERTRESALLRALGLQRRQLRAMLAVEAVLLAGVGAVIGIGAGVLFGLVGTAALVKETDLEHLRFAMSVPHTLGVVLVACLAAAVASVLPARRAAMAAPVDALAET